MPLCSPAIWLLQGRWLSHRLPPPYPGGPMCGIVAVLRRSSGRMPPDGAHLLAELEQAVAALADQGIAGPQVLTPVAERVEAVDAMLHGAPGVRALLADRALAVGVEHHVEQLQLAADRVEHALDANDPAIAHLLEERRDPLFGSRAVRNVGGCLSFVYKAAAEIGELGDNTASLRAAIRDDEFLHLAVAAETAQAVVLAHTRWASVGIISEANAHPVNSEEVGHVDGPYVIGALNGDVDNFADLEAIERLDVPTEMTTDAKVIPTLVSRRLAGGEDVDEAFRATVASLEGSVAIAAGAAEHPDRVLLALRGSGQA